MGFILVVDDQPVVSFVKREALERAGHLVFLAGSGAEASQVAAPYEAYRCNRR